MESTGNNVITGAEITNTGLIEVFSGTLTITGTLLGDGTIQVDEGAELILGADVSIDQTIVVDGSGSTELQFDADFGGKIQGLGVSDRLDLSTITYDVHTTATYTWNGLTNSGILTVTNGSQSISLTLIGTDYTNAHLMGASDGHGGTLITFNALDTAPDFADGKPAAAIFQELPDHTDRPKPILTPPRAEASPSPMSTCSTGRPRRWVCRQSTTPARTARSRCRRSSSRRSRRPSRCRP